MRILLLLLLTIHSYSSIAQKKMFVRILDANGKRITAGRISTWNDSSVTILVNATRATEITVNQMGVIKTKRSIGHNMAMGALIGAGTFAILGAASGESEPAGPYDFFYITPAEGAAAGFILGIPFGAAVGALTGLLKHSKVYSINGDRVKWKAFQSTLTQPKD